MAYSDKHKFAALLMKKTLNIFDVFENEPMKNHTSFKTGGDAYLLVNARNIDEAKNAITCLSKNDIPFFVMGNGTNLLVRDGGYKGVIVKIREHISSVSINGNVITAEPGALISDVSKIALNHSLAGLEFAEGIPGTVGGAVAMNAGAYGGEMKDIVLRVTAFDSNGSFFELNGSELDFSYRCSALQKQGLTCAKVVFGLNYGSKDTIKSKMDENKKNRIYKQPLEKPSAGSTFKRPKGYYAGKLIMDAGLRGYCIGGASVSEKHCGFVINNGGATAADIVNLITHIQNTVYEKFGVHLETEVKIIGEK